jgi:glycosyltransferase involved in cell wall biosynthesis
MNTSNPPTLILCVDARFLTPHFPGIGRVLSALLSEWAHHPHVAALHIITNQRQPASCYATPVATATTHYHSIDAHPFGILEAIAIRRIVMQVHPDWYYSPHFWLPWLPLPTRLLATIHDAIPLHADHVPPIKRWLITALMRWCIWRANCITTVSGAAAHQLTQAFSIPQLSVIPNGAPVPLPPLPVPTGIATPYVLCVSSNQPHKNLSTLCAAWQQLWQQQLLPASYQLIIAGHIDPRYPHPKHWFAGSDAPYTVVANPTEAQLHALYQHADCFVTPSLAEGHGLPVYEALSYGLAVLHHHEFPNQTQLATSTYHCDMRTPAHLAHALSALLNTQTPPMPQLIPHLPSWAHVAQAYLDVMQKSTSTQQN